MSKSEDSEMQEELLLCKADPGDHRDDDDDKALHLRRGRVPTHKCFLENLRLWRAISLFSLSLNIVLASGLYYAIWPSRTSVFPGILHNAATVQRTYEVATDYGNEGNDTPTNEALWDEILDVHGIVAVDTNWAKRQHLLPSRPLLSDTSKSIYAIEAYHSLHCLKTARKAFFTILHQGNVTSLGSLSGHINHCFDTIRQSITCSAADNLLPYNDEGMRPGQLRQCKDWGALRDWSTRHTPCTGDTSKNVDIHGNICHGGDDGIRTDI